MSALRRIPFCALAALVVLAVLPARPASAAALLRTSDAEGVAVNRVAVKATRDGRVLHVESLVVGRALGDGPVTLPLTISRCDAAGARCRVAARRTDDLAPAESRATWNARVAVPRRGGALVVRLGARSLRLVLPPTAWAGDDPSWYGLKTPPALWGSDVFRAVRVTGRAGTGHDVLTSVTASVALPATTLLDGLIGRLAATAERWLTGATTTDTPGDGRQTLTASATLSPPFRAGGYGVYVTADGEPFMVVWLPPPA